MRLTLRTMLAYMDDILEPADAQDVGKKIEESEFATGLMHRMRDVTRRLRVGAPKLHGRGLGHDANTVAEYLDNTLPSERVADFEKVCLESDVHLAEVTAAHQILALVLGEPAEIEATGKQRMYGLPSEAETLTRRSAARKSDGAERRRRRKKKRRKVKVPDYLREPAAPAPRSRRQLVLLLILLLLGAGAVGGYAWIKTHPDQLALLTGGAAGNADQIDAERGGAPQAKPNHPPAASSDMNQTNAADKSATLPAGSRATPATDQSDQGPPIEAANTRDEEDAAPEQPPVEPEPPDAGPIKKSAPQRNDEAPPENADGARQPAPPDTSDEEASAPIGEGVGRLISEHEVLVRTSGKQLRRVPGRGTVYAGETLLALPTYRPSIVLASGITVQLYGGAKARVAAVDGEDVPEMQLDFGRMVLLSAARPGLRVRLRIGDRQGLVSFGQEDAVLAVDVAHKLNEGSDPEREPAAAQVDLYVASGEIAWQDDQGRTQTIRGKAHLPLSRAGAAGGQTTDELPVWIEENDLTPMERRGAASVENYLHTDKPIGPTLVDLLGHRLQENTILAVQSLALIGEFDPLVPLLNDPKRRRLDNNDIASVRAALARGPETAARVRQAFESVRGEKQGDELYRMLWGYSPEQLEEGGAAQLIEWLSHEDLDYRVLSFWNLHHVTGFSYFYKPEDTEAKRRTPVQRWRQKLEAGLIVPRAEPG